MPCGAKANNGRKTSIYISFYYELFIVDSSSGESYVLKTCDKLLCYYYASGAYGLTIYLCIVYTYRKHVHDGYSLIIIIIITNIITVGIGH